MTISFDGTKKLESVGGGCIKAYWRHASSDIGVDSYDMYIRAENPDVFYPDYVWANLPYRYTGGSYITSAILRTEADADTFLRNGTMYYIGMKAVETTGNIDTNTVVKYEKVIGDGSAPVEVPDRKVAKAI